MKSVSIFLLAILLAPPLYSRDGGLLDSSEQMSAWLPILKASLEITGSPSESVPHYSEVVWDNVFSLKGQLEGAMGMMRFAEMDHPGTYKFPPNYTVPQLLRIVDKYARDNPQFLNQPELIFIIMALSSQFIVPKT